MSLATRYTILRKIADGGTAEIFLAKQHGAQGFEKMVVLKRIFTTFYADPQFRHMLVDEAHVAMTLNHSNVVQVLDLGEADGRYFLALELVDGWTLDRILRRSKAAGVQFPPALALYLTAEVCRALAYAHGKKRADGMPLGIVHCDISPHNVMVSEQGEVKLTDFGIAKAQTRREASVKNLIKGKIAFMSPEQASAGELDARSDLFSVGTMLYVMITRRHPFDAPTDYEALMLVKSGNFVPPETARPGLNPELYRVMRKAMGKAPADRYQSAEEMLLDVEQVMRVAFRPVGQTELQRWLAELSAKDGVPTLTREAPPEPPASRSTVGPLRGGEGQESGLVLNLEDAVEVKGGAKRPPPPPAPTVPMMRPPAFVAADRPFVKRTGVRMAGTAVIVLLLVWAVRSLSPGKQTGAPVASGHDVAPGTSAVPPTPPSNPPPASNPGPAPTVPPAALPSSAPPIAASTPPASGGSLNVAVAPTPPVAKASPEPTPMAGDGAAAHAAAGEAADKSNDGPAEEHAAASNEATVSKPKQQRFAVVIKTDPEDSRVSTGKHVFGTTPLTLKLRPGSVYELTFTKPGYLPVTQRYRFDAEEPQTLRVSLAKKPEAAAKPSARSTTPPPPTSKGGWFVR
jgi:serine/threonine protein kinase